MDLNNFISKLKEQYLGNQIFIEPSTKFREISGWDSMTGMTILFMIEEEYGVKVEELFEYIKESVK
jgi:acyl carrier protein